MRKLISMWKFSKEILAWTLKASIICSSILSLGNQGQESPFMKFHVSHDEIQLSHSIDIPQIL